MLTTKVHQIDEQIAQQSPQKHSGLGEDQIDITFGQNSEEELVLDPAQGSADVEAVERREVPASPPAIAQEEAPAAEEPAPEEVEETAAPVKAGDAEANANPNSESTQNEVNLV